MPNHDWRVLVQDMLSYAERAREYAANKSFDEFQTNMLVQDATLRCLEIIGEAARLVPDEIRTRATDIPWGQIVATRHILVHHYAKVDVELVWRVVQDRLPPLIASLIALLATP